MGISIDNFPDACLILNVENIVVGINPAGEYLLKIKQADAVGKSVDEVFSRRSIILDADAALSDGWKDTAAQSGVAQINCAEFKVSTVKGPDGVLMGRIAILRDLDLPPQSLSLKSSHRLLTAFQETTFDLYSRLELETLLRNIVRRACKLLNTSHGFLDILNDGVDELQPVIGIGALEESLKYKIVRGEGVAGIVWETGTPLVVNDYDRWPDRVKSFRYGVIRAIVGMPLILGEQVVGVIGIARDVESTKGFSEEDISILKRFSELVVIAMRNASLYEKAQKEIDFRRKTEIELRNSNQLLQLQIERVELLQTQLREAAVRDSLTNLFNRRYLQEMLEVEFARARRSETSLAALMIDCDHLKNINDRFGHKAGDDFLVHIANVIRKSIRAGDIACRYGGDEFVVILGNMNEETAFERAEKLRKSVAVYQVLQKNEETSISVSIGIAIFPVHCSTGETLLQKADQALYKAKQKGKNCVVVYSQEEENI